VQKLALSPTFGVDGTLFAIAWGPLSDTTFFSSPATLQARGLFVSRDRGASWTLQLQLPPAIWASRELLALSPTFERDGLMLWAHSTSGPSPASSNCPVSRSVDAGASWAVVLPAGSYEGCGALGVFSVGDRTLATVDKGMGRRWSDDGGQTWTSAMVSNAFGQLPFALTLSSGDRALFAATRSAPAGVSGINTLTGPASGSIACAFGTQLGFDRVYRASAEARDLLGCPIGDETNERIRTSVAQVGSTTVYGYWVLDDSPDLYIADENSVTRVSKQQGWLYPVQSERTVDGSVQSFEGGQMLYIPATDSSQPGQIVVLGLSMWRIYPDSVNG
jgi:hypothetical protein